MLAEEAGLLLVLHKALLSLESVGSIHVSLQDNQEDERQEADNHATSEDVTVRREEHINVDSNPSKVGENKEQKDEKHDVGGSIEVITRFLQVLTWEDSLEVYPSLERS